MGRRTLVLIVALLLAGVAAFAVYRFLTGVQNEQIEATSFQQVYRTSNRIEAGTSGDLVIQQFDERLEVSDEVVELTPQLAVDTEPLAAGEVGLDEALSGKVAAGPIPEGAVVTTDMWIDAVQAAQSLDQVVGSGNQAVTVPVEASRAVAGFIRPGDSVNVLVTLTVEGTPIQDAPDIDPQQESGSGEPETITKTLTRYVLFNKRVLAVDDQVVSANGEDSAAVSAPAPTPSDDSSVTTPTTPETGGGNGSPVDRVQLVTLEVDSQEAEQLVFAVEAGDIWLTLATDQFVVEETGGVVIDSLFGEDAGVLDQYFDLP